MRETIAASTAPDTAPARKAMVDSQLRTSGVNEEYVLARMLAVPRENFVPADKAPLAYIDRTLALGNGAVLAPPLFYGKVLVEAAPRRDDRVLVISAGTAYLAELVRPLVRSVDQIPAEEAAVNAPAAGESYSLILVDGAIEELRDSVSARLEEGGRLVGGMVLRQVTRLASGRKIAGRVSLLPIEDIGIPVLAAFAAPRKWSFT
ncbi:MAG: protein-L-isoaspartate O-methyltransferase [Erythrobacter sp.]|jgi:protein-L-isoaspartate(D-aspartate) O-methyltransferase|nr:protein-L-isoaspartate O-methyltransferase [Erythrobacter sp.]